MSPEIRQAGETAPESNVNREPDTLAKLPPAAQSFEQKTKEISRQIVLLLDRAGEIFGEYKPVVIAIGIALAALPLLAFIVALLTVINVLPLLAPTFKLIGFGFTIWFIYRYVLFAPNRQELSQEVQDLKDHIVGPGDESLKSSANPQMKNPQATPTQIQTNPEPILESTPFSEPGSKAPKSGPKLAADKPGPEVPVSDPGRTSLGLPPELDPEV